MKTLLVALLLVVSVEVKGQQWDCENLLPTSERYDWCGWFIKVSISFSDTMYGRVSDTTHYIDYTRPADLSCRYAPARLYNYFDEYFGAFNTINLIYIEKQYW